MEVQRVTILGVWTVHIVARQNIGFNIVGCRQLWLVPLRSLSNVIMSLMH